MSLSSEIHGTKPKVAPFIETDPIEMLKKLLNGEITDWPQIQQLSKLFQQNQFDQMGFDLPGLIAKGGQDAQTLLDQAGTMEKGQIPADVAAQVMRSSAFQSLGAGSMGGPMGSALAARNLGLTSLDMIRQGADLATSGGNATQRWQQVAQGTMLPSSAYLYSPQWFTDYMAKQAAAKRDALQQKYNVDAMPDPAWAARGKLLASYGGMALGGGMGGGGASNALDYSSSVPTTVPAGGMSGWWAQMTGQPYDALGSNTGAVTTGWNNAVPFLTTPEAGSGSGAVNTTPYPYSIPPNPFNSVNPPGGSYNPSVNYNF